MSSGDLAVVLPAVTPVVPPANLKSLEVWRSNTIIFLEALQGA